MAQNIFLTVCFVVAILILAFFKVMYDSYRVVFWLAIAFIILAPACYFLRFRIRQALRHIFNRPK
jgi:putative effector of murein hydrolase